MKTRDYYFDNVKALLIVLVVFGHLIEFSVPTNADSESLYKMIYYFHMPAFILVSGFFAKKSMERIDIKSLLWKIALPYIIFQVIYVPFHNQMLGTELENSILTPYWVLWFLMSLFCWHIMLHLFKQLKWSLLWAVLIGLLASIYGEVDGSFSLARTLVYFPFFLLGAKLNKKHFFLLKNNVMKMLSILVLIGFYWFVKNQDRIPFEFLWGSLHYDYFGLSDLEGVMLRGMQYGIALVVTAAVMSLVPVKKNILSPIGSFTIYIFLLHGFLVRTLQKYQPDFLMEVTTTSYIHFLLIALAFSLLMTLPWIQILFKPFVEPSAIFRKK